ncbi:unnamed protein product [Porites evermanni]|uniref:Uncharacterized protein n=1 Tax=Porites evermanni TaxID=104178 RepID=A0ABN8LDA2_9CNID|nr:unnamed protein product [Porites evermanni]CAH3154496.1 unnamed protein product [Porites evermanni]
MALSAFSNRSLLKCAATLSGRDTQSEMETETSCEAQALTLELLNLQNAIRICSFCSYNNVAYLAIFMGFEM